MAVEWKRPASSPTMEKGTLAKWPVATASFAHRAIDGAAAARFMAAFRDLVEKPIQVVR